MAPGGRRNKREARPSTASSVHRYLGPLTETNCYYKVYGTLPDGTPISEVSPDVRVGSVTPLEVTHVDLLIQENAKSHFTDKYEVTMPHSDEVTSAAMDAELLVRRGQAFIVLITFNRDVVVGQDSLRLGFEIGTKPLISKGTAVVVEASGNPTAAAGQWYAKTVETAGPKVKVSVCSPATAQIGRWAMYIETLVTGGKQPTEVTISRYLFPKNIIILFNPWCKDDDVFLDDEEQRQEYVLNDTGTLFIGNRKQISGRPWTFGQFDDVTIKCVLWLLENKSALDIQQHGDVVRLTRDISAFVNSNDEKGLMEGRWDGNYEDGVAPTTWISSTAIFRQYMEAKKPVKYGQCWVFSGVTTAVCRCLGIPARSVTNFSSAHDTDGSMTIDCHFSAAGLPLEDENVDSIWNFHVWNDVWMARRDLPAGYGGWQALDATPQETSGGVFCAGPASVAAVKQGLVTLPYDTGFVFAEVNADRINWIKQENGSYRKVVESDVVGCNISTKPCPKKSRFLWTFSDREDLTSAYKYPEGSWEERASVRQAMSSSTKPEAYDWQAHDLTFTADDKEHVMLGNSFDAPVKVKNNSNARRQVSIVMSCTSVYYTGVPHRLIKTVPHTDSLAPGEEKTFSMTVSWREYSHQLVDQYDVRVQTLASVAETKQVFLHHDDFRLLRPSLKLEVPEKVQAGESFVVKVSFVNPLPCLLTGCTYTVDGSCLVRPVEMPTSAVRQSQQSSAEIRVQTKATSSGPVAVMASFDSFELRGCTGAASFTLLPEIKPAPPASGGAADVPPPPPSTSEAEAASKASAAAAPAPVATGAAVSEATGPSRAVSDKGAAAAAAPATEGNGNVRSANVSAGGRGGSGRRRRRH